jgi:hypothetical protein
MLIVSHMLIDAYCITCDILMSELVSRHEVEPTLSRRIGEGIGLSEDQSYELFGQLVDEGFVDPGRAYQAGGAMPGSISRIVGREENMTVIGDELRLTDKGRSEVG